MTMIRGALHLPKRAASSYSSPKETLRLLDNPTELRQRAMEQGRFLVFSKEGLRPLMMHPRPLEGPKWMTYTELKRPIDDLDPLVLLYVDPLGCPVLSTTTDLNTSEEGSFTSLRSVLFSLDNPLDPPALSKAYSLLKWHQTHRFCHICGSSNLLRTPGGLKITCGACQEIVYPQTNPVGIVLILHPTEEKTLLVNLHRHPPSHYSCVAGFADPGESLEDTVGREAMEEVGLEIQHPTYVASQHWPFPTGSLMMGFRALATGENYEILPEEVKDARWFDKVEIRSALEGKADFRLPPRGAIARTLIEKWTRHE